VPLWTSPCARRRRLRKLNVLTPCFVVRRTLALYQRGASCSTLVRQGDEFLSNVVWSADGTGLLFVAMKGGVQAVATRHSGLWTSPRFDPGSHFGVVKGHHHR
jgi:hypothetical protein